APTARATDRARAHGRRRLTGGNSTTRATANCVGCAFTGGAGRGIHGVGICVGEPSASRALDGPWTGPGPGFSRLARLQRCRQRAVGCRWTQLSYQRAVWRSRGNRVAQWNAHRVGTGCWTQEWALLGEPGRGDAIALDRRGGQPGRFTTGHAAAQLRG